MNMQGGGCIIIRGPRIIIHCAKCTNPGVFRAKSLCSLPIDKRAKKWYNKGLSELRLAAFLGEPSGILYKYAKTLCFYTEGFGERRYSIEEIGRAVRRHCPKPLSPFELAVQHIDNLFRTIILVNVMVGGGVGEFDNREVGATEFEFIGVRFAILNEAGVCAVDVPIIGIGIESLETFGGVETAIASIDNEFHFFYLPFVSL